MSRVRRMPVACTLRPAITSNKKPASQSTQRSNNYEKLLKSIFLLIPSIYDREKISAVPLEIHGITYAYHMPMVLLVLIRRMLYTWYMTFNEGHIAGSAILYTAYRNGQFCCTLLDWNVISGQFVAPPSETNWNIGMRPWDCTWVPRVNQCVYAVYSCKAIER